MATLERTDGPAPGGPGSVHVPSEVFGWRTALPIPRIWLVTVAVVSCVLVGAMASVSLALGLALVVGLAGGLYLLRRPALVTLLVVALVPVTSGLRRGFPIPGLRVSEALIVLGAVALLVVYARVLPGPTWTRVDAAALAYTTGALVFSFLNAAIHRQDLTVSDLQLAVGPIQFMLLYRVVAAGLATRRLRVLALRLLLLASVPVSLLALAQRLGPAKIQDQLISLTGTTVFNTPGWTPVPRVTSVFPIWHALGGYLVVVCLLGVALLVVRDGEVLPVPVMFVVLGLGAAAIVLTLTITIVVGLVLGILIVGQLTGQLRRVLTWMTAMGVAAGVIFLPLILQRAAAQAGPTGATSSSVVPQTVQYRFSVWSEQYLPAMRGTWLTGWGPADPPGIVWTHTESGYLTVLLRGGIPYLAVTAVLMALVGVGAHRIFTTSEDRVHRATALAVLALIIVLVPMDFLFPYLTDSGLPQPMWALWGVLAAAGPRRGSPVLGTSRYRVPVRTAWGLPVQEAAGPHGVRGG